MGSLGRGVISVFNIHCIHAYNLHSLAAQAEGILPLHHLSLHLRILDECVVDISFLRILVVKEPHLVFDVKLAELKHLLTVFKSTQEGQHQLETDPRENYVLFAHHTHDTHELDSDFLGQLRMNCHVHEKVKVCGV